MATRIISTDSALLADTIGDLVADRCASRLRAADDTLWGEDAQPEASIRLGWVDLLDETAALLPRLSDLRHELLDRGINRFVLCGMGGSSLAPEVLCAAAGVELHVLDSSHPTSVKRALTAAERTCVVVSSKSGSTIETDSQRRVLEAFFIEAGLSPADHMIAVTDPGSDLDRHAQDNGWHVFHANPQVGGRYSALSAFGAVPSALAGVNMAQIIDQARQADSFLWLDEAQNPAIVLGAFLGAAARKGRDRLVLRDGAVTGLGDWIEQLVAESTGKLGTGILPIVNPQPSNAPNLSVVDLGDPGNVDRESTETSWCAVVDAPLGEQFLTWEIATVLASRILGVNPFDQPDVESTKKATRQRLASQQIATIPGPASVEELLASIPSNGYLAVQAYLDSAEHRELPAALMRLLANKTSRATTFGWGPRFLHSTGQYHKGGPARGGFLQILDEPSDDIEVPGRDFTLRQLIASQAAADAHVLASRGMPVLTMSLSAVLDWLDKSGQ